MFRTSQKYLWQKTSCSDRFHPHENIIASTLQSHGPVVLTLCRYYKTPNFSSRNHYELLGVEKTATHKEIKKAFYKLSKEYHPDSNSADKSLHEKFVRINEAFSILSKPSTRITYDQSLSSVSRTPHQTYTRPTSSDWSNINANNRYAYQRRANTNDFNWGTPNYDNTFYDLLRRKMEQDRQRSGSQSQYYYNSSHNLPNNYFASFSLILIVIGFGMFIHALQWRNMHYADSQYKADPRISHYRAYREWQRLHSAQEPEYTAKQQEPSSSTDEK